MTEATGWLWGLVAAAFFADFLRRRPGAFAGLFGGMFAQTLALAARSGAMFVVPVIYGWAAEVRLHRAAAGAAAEAQRAAPPREDG